MFKNVFSKLRYAFHKKDNRCDNNKSDKINTKPNGVNSPFSEELSAKDLLEDRRSKDQSESRDDINNASSNMKCPSCNQSLITSMSQHGVIDYFVRDTTSIYNSKIYIVERHGDLYNSLGKLDLDNSEHIVKAQSKINTCIKYNIGVCRCFLDKRSSQEFRCPVCNEANDSREWINNGTSYNECVLCGSEAESIITSTGTHSACLKNKNHKIEIGD